MEFLEARRLTGPNVLWDKESAILDISCSADEANQLIPYCESQIRLMLDAVGWQNESITHARLAGGVSIAFSAPIDTLYSASAIAEWAWASCDAEFRGATAPDFAATVTEISDAIAEEVNPPLLILEQAAIANNASFRWDDDDVSALTCCPGSSPLRSTP